MRVIPGLTADQRRITVPAASGSPGIVNIYVENGGLVIK
jgi:hypothetical protein